MNKKLLIAVFVSAIIMNYTEKGSRSYRKMYGRVIRVLSYNVRNG